MAQTVVEGRAATHLAAPETRFVCVLPLLLFVSI
jgi:hypothetical protein